ncbi:hypothetical protein BDQ12DRAFT_677665 [Crucibulum laeve]|uniref:Uncharacterized protein n=1 Tax=Crucibulum laeve TaxID=68775 RepID=A0A5C3M9N6_9AGAR|nr:hypothetical protein BDQ12DRAFT_677665 [Crucibulum laeve]
MMGFFHRAGNTFTVPSSYSGSSSSGSSSPSLSIISPVLIACAGAIHTYGCGAYLTLTLTATLFNSFGRISNIVLPDTKAVVPRGTDNSSPVRSSYLHTCLSPFGTMIPYSVVTRGGLKSYKAASTCHL